MGGNVGQGALYGAIGGTIGGAFSIIGSKLGAGAAWAADKPFATVGGKIGGALGAAGGGALSALVTGGDPGMSAAVAGISAGVGYGISFNTGSPTKDWFAALAVSTCTGAGIGGTVAEIKGGDFWNGAAMAAATSASGFAISSTLGPYVGAVVEDIIYGPVDQIVVYGRRQGSTVFEEIHVKAYRFMEKIGYLWTPSRNEFHCDQGFVSGLRKHQFASKANPVTNMNAVSAYEGIAAHEIGHTTQFSPLPIIGEVLYGLSVVPCTIIHHTMRGLGVSHTPIFSHFEKDADLHGEYGGTK